MIPATDWYAEFEYSNAHFYNPLICWDLDDNGNITGFLTDPEKPRKIIAAPNHAAFRGYYHVSEIDQ